MPQYQFFSECLFQAKGGKTYGTPQPVITVLQALSKKTQSFLPCALTRRTLISPILKLACQRKHNNAIGPTGSGGAGVPAVAECRRWRPPRSIVGAAHASAAKKKSTTYHADPETPGCFQRCFGRNWLAGSIHSALEVRRKGNTPGLVAGSFY